MPALVRHREATLDALLPHGRDGALAHAEGQPIVRRAMDDEGGRLVRARADVVERGDLVELGWGGFGEAWRGRGGRGRRGGVGEPVDEVGDRAAVPAHVQDDPGARVGQREGEGEGAFGGEGRVFDDLV